MSNLPANADRPRLLNPKPGELMDPIVSNEHLYDLAGITKEERGSLLRDTVDVAKQLLHAKVRKVFQSNQRIIYSRLLPDNLTRSRTVEQMMSIVGLSKKDVPKIDVHVTVNQPPWMISADIPPPPKNITPEDDHVS